MSSNLKSFVFLTFELVKRDVRARYVGSSLGIFWSFLMPILQLILFTFVFSYVLKISLLGEKGVESFALFLFSGLIPWMGIQEMLSRSTTVLNDQSAIIKKLSFPQEILIFSIFGSAVVHQLIASGIFIFVLIFMGKLYLSIIFLPILMIIEVIFISGFCFFFSALNPFFKDTSQAISYILMVWFYGTPIVYPLSLVPENFKKILLINPLTYLIESFRDIFLRGLVPSWEIYIYVFALGIVLMFFGFLFFNKMKRYFSDLI